MTAVLKPVGESDPFLLTNLSPRSTGLPVVVWVHERGHVEVEGDLSAADRQAVLGWIERNRPVLTDHWTGDIDSSELCARIVRV